MNRATILPLCGLAFGLGACAPAVFRPGSPPQRIVNNEREVAEHLDSAKARLDIAALRGDLAGVLDRFTPGAMVIFDGRDTLRGREAIARWITDHLAGTAGAKVAFRDARIFVCRDGAVELRGTLLTRLGGRDDIQPANAVYFAKWRDDGKEGWRIDRLEAMRAMERAPDFGRYCPSFLADEFDARRVFVALSAGRGIQQSLGEDITGTMSGRGYRPGTAVYITSEYNQRSPSAFDERIVSVRAMVWRRLWVQALAQPSTVAWARYGANGSSQVMVTADMRWSALMAGWQWGRFRAGAGPVAYDAATSTLEEQPLPFPGSARVLNRAAQKPTGFIVEGAYMVPVGNWFFADFRLQHRTGSVDAPGSGFYPPSSVALGDTRLQLHIGLAVY